MRQMRQNKEELTKYLIIIIIYMFMFSACIFQAPDHFTPSEKVQFTTMKGLKTAHTFRIFALDSAKVYWDAGIMTEETMEDIVKIGDEFQKAINDASLALETYRKNEGMNSADLGNKIELYQALYVRFNNLVMPYIIKAVE